MRALSPPGVSRPVLWAPGSVLCLRAMSTSVKARLALAVALCFGLQACSSMHMPHVWPFYKKPKPEPEAVHEVDLVNADGTPATIPQYWKRNTLVIDLSGVSGTGSVAARLLPETTWPVRVAIRVRPGSVQQVEVQGEERTVLAVAAEGTLPLDLELAPSVYRPNTGAIYFNWGNMPQFAEVVLEPQEKGFVSPTVVPPHPEPAAAPAKEDAETETPGANQIIPPSEAAPAPKN